MEGYFGEIRLFAGNYAPKNWAFCDGQSMSIQENQALYSLIGTSYGGDGQNIFKLPAIEPIIQGEEEQAAIRYIICIDGIYPPRD